MAEKRHAFGTKLRMGDGADPEVFTTIASVKTVPFPTKSPALIDVTDHDSPNGDMEYISGLKDSDELTVTVHYDPNDSTHDELWDKCDTGELTNFEIEMNNAVSTKGTTFGFAAIVRKFVPKGEISGAYEADITLKPSGSITLTPAS